MTSVGFFRLRRASSCSQRFEGFRVTRRGDSGFEKIGSRRPFGFWGFQGGREKKQVAEDFGRRRFSGRETDGNSSRSAHGKHVACLRWAQLACRRGCEPSKLISRQRGSRRECRWRPAADRRVLPLCRERAREAHGRPIKRCHVFGMYLPSCLIQANIDRARCIVTCLEVLRRHMQPYFMLQFDDWSSKKCNIIY